MFAALVEPMSLFHMAALAIARSEGSGQDFDQTLIKRMKDGDRRAFDLLFQRHADEVFRRLTRLVGNDPDQEDLVQEVFISVARGVQRFRGESSFSTWLYRIIVNVAYAHLRKRRRRPAEVSSWDALELHAEASRSPEAQAEIKQEIERALGFLNRLKPKKRIAFVLRVVEGMSLQEIGEIVDARPAAVGQRVKHAQRELEKMIEHDRRRRGLGK